MILRTENLVKAYRQRKVVDHVSVYVKQGEIVGLLGPNGAGKTTTFYMTVGLVRPDEGKILLDQLDITHQPMYKRAKEGIGYLPQEASIFRKLTDLDRPVRGFAIGMGTMNKTKKSLKYMYNMATDMYGCTIRFTTSHSLLKETNYDREAADVYL